jgi:hypothetical membrane protein
MNSAPTRPFALAGVMQPLWFLGAAALYGAARPGYDMTHAISELGEQGAPGALVWNVAGFGVGALLYAVFASAVRSALGGGWLYRVVLLQAIFLAASGTFACDPGCPPVMSSWQGWAHTVVGLVYFTLTCAAPLVAWRELRMRHGWRPLASRSLVAGIALTGLFFAGPLVFGPSLVGVWQRVTLTVAGVWMSLLAVSLRRALPAREATG